MGMKNETPYGHLICKAMRAYVESGLPGFDDSSMVFRMNSRFKTVLGICRYRYADRSCLIEFSEELFAKLTDEQRYLTVAHEIAHGICFLRGLDDGHGSTWKRICVIMGGTGERCSNLGVAVRNLINRVVMRCRLDGKMYVITKQNYDKLSSHTLGLYSYVGVISLDRNNFSYRWVSLDMPMYRDERIGALKDSRWKMVA
jgi:hypothetical protein